MSVKAKIIENIFSLQQQYASKEKKLIDTVTSFQPYQPPKIYNLQFDITEITINGYPCVIFKPKKNVTKKRIIYIHGGGYVFPITQFHYNFVARIIKKTGATVYFPIYPPCTPTYSSNKDTLKMICDLYKEIIANTDHNDITIMGDSAGANISLVVAQQIKLMSLLPPKNVIVISPLTDLSIDNHEIDLQMKNEPVLPKWLVNSAFTWYVHGDDPHKSIFSPIYGDSKDIGLISIFIGEREALLKSTKIFSEKLNEQHIIHNLHIEPEVFHVYALFKIKEAKTSFDKIVNLINN